MIFIFSEESDVATSKVIDWLNYYSAPYLRINLFKEKLDIDISIRNNGESIRFNYKDYSFAYEDISVVWFRRGALNLLLPTSINDFVSNNVNYKSKIDYHISNEIKDLSEFAYIKLSEKSINNPLLYKVNKLQALSIANSLGLLIPKTIVSNSISKIKEYFSQESHIISKPISDVLKLDFDVFAQPRWSRFATSIKYTRTLRKTHLR